MPSNSPLSLACDVLDAIPECVCTYLAVSDLLLPNVLWRSQLGEVSRLRDLQRFGIDTDTLAHRMERGVDMTADPIMALMSDGTQRPLRVCPVQGRGDIYIFLLHDETELRRVEQMRKDFIANVSHELRTPLTAVRGYIETLMDPSFLTTDNVQKFLPVIFEHTERLHNLMLDLLSLSRLESPGTHIDTAPFSLDEALEDAVEATAPLARMKNIRVELKPPDPSVRVLANAEHLERILVNLLDNAIKYSAHGDRVSIWTERDGDMIWTHVKDDGVGISAEELPRVFERFYRTKGALGGGARGSGLGLAIVKHIVQQLGGEIRVSSELGKGSDFYFSLRLDTAGL